MREKIIVVDTPQNTKKNEDLLESNQNCMIQMHYLLKSSFTQLTSKVSQEKKKATILFHSINCQKVIPMNNFYEHESGFTNLQVL